MLDDYVRVGVTVPFVDALKRSAMPLPQRGLVHQTMREWYAAVALQAIVANQAWNATSLELLNISPGQAPACAAVTAVAYADALLAELAKK